MARQSSLRVGMASSMIYRRLMLDFIKKRRDEAKRVEMARAMATAARRYRDTRHWHDMASFRHCWRPCRGALLRQRKCAKRQALSLAAGDYSPH